MFWKKNVNYVCPSNKIPRCRVGNQINRPCKSELNFIWSDSESKLQQNNQISWITFFILDLPKLWNKLFLVNEENLANNQKIGWFKNNWWANQPFTFYAFMFRSLEETEVISSPFLISFSICRLFVDWQNIT